MSKQLIQSGQSQEGGSADCTEEKDASSPSDLGSAKEHAAFTLAPAAAHEHVTSGFSTLLHTSLSGMCRKRQ